jgi:hypothetical protein
VSYGDHLARFQQAIQNSDADAALGAARKMGTVGLYDALKLCRVLARAQHPLFERAALRWLVLLAGTEEARLSDLQVGSAALETLGAEPESKEAWETLADLMLAG